MARPKRGNYATGAEGQARYRKAVTEYLKKQKEAREKKTKITSTKKNIAKQKATNKKAVTDTKAKATAKPKTTAKPKATTAKGQTLATGKTSKPKTTAATTTTTTRRKTTTKPKTTAKKPVAKKPAGKVPARKPIISNKNKLRIKKAATTAKNTTVKTAKTVAKKAGEAKKVVTKKVDQVKKTFKKSKAPRPTTPQQKAVSKVYQGTKKYGKRILKKGGKDLLKIGKGILKNPKSAIKGGVAGIATAGLTDAINTRMDRAFAKRKGMTLKEYQAFKKDPKNQRGIVSTTKKVISKIRGKSNTNNNLSTKKNIQKQKSNNSGLKTKKTERSSKVNRNKDYNAKTATKKRNTGLSEFRVDPKENRKLQLEAQNKKPITYSRELSSTAKKQVSDTKNNTNKKTTRSSFNEKFIKGKGGRLLRRGSVTARRAENKERARKRAQELAKQRRQRKLRK
tara:strand:+ start:74 stop:1429 length:1356 start_codon:yes stop_codon:yes gene_type:complete